MKKLPPGPPGDLQRRLFQISEALSLEAVPSDSCKLQEPHWILGAHYDSAPGTLGDAGDWLKSLLEDDIPMPF